MTCPVGPVTQIFGGPPVELRTHNLRYRLPPPPSHRGRVKGFGAKDRVILQRDDIGLLPVDVR